MPASNVIEIVVRVVDQATAGIRTVTTQVNALGERVKAAMGGMSALAKNALTFLGVGTAVYAAGAAFRKMVTAIEENETAVAQLEAGIRSTGGVAGYTVEQLQDMAAHFQDITAYGDEAINQMQSVLLTFTKIRGEQFEQATMAVANLAARLKVDLQAAALQVGKALNDPVLGVSMLSRAGIQFTATQKQMIKSLVDTNQMVEAQKIVLAELETQFGGSAEAARNTFSGALAAVRNRFGDLFEASKETVQPATDALNDLERTLNSQGMKDGFQALLGAMLGIMGILAKFAGFIGQIVAGLNVLTGNTGDRVEDINDEVEKLDKMIARASPGSIWRKLLFQSDKDADEYIAMMREQRARVIQEQQEILDGVRDRAGNLKVKPQPVAIAPVVQPDVLEKLTKAIQSTETPLQKQRREIQENIDFVQKLIDEYSNYTAAQRDAAGLSEEQFAAARVALAKLKNDLANVGWEEMVAKLEVKISSKRILDPLTQQQREWLNETRTSLQIAGDEWAQYVARLQHLRDIKAQGFNYEEALADFLNNKFVLAQKAQGVIEQLRTPIEKVDNDFREMQRSLQNYLDFLTTHGGSKERIAEVEAAMARLPKAYTEALDKARAETDRWIAFQQRAAERLQDAFSNAFMEIGNGWKKFGTSILTAIKSIFSEALSLQLIKGLQLDKFIKQGVGAIFGGASKETEAKLPTGKPGLSQAEAQAEAARRVEEIKARADQVAAVKDNTTKVTGTLDTQTQSIVSAIQQNDPCACVDRLVNELRKSQGDVVAPEPAETTVRQQVSMPEITGQQISLPELPPITVASLPPVEVADIRAPKIPPVTVEQIPPVRVEALPDIRVPQLPPIDVARIPLPVTIESMPTIAMPELSTISVDRIPPVEVSELPSVTIDDARAPKSPPITVERIPPVAVETIPPIRIDELPVIRVPELPPIEVARIPLPVTIENMPAISMPELSSISVDRIPPVEVSAIPPVEVQLPRIPPVDVGTIPPVEVKSAQITLPVLPPIDVATIPPVTIPELPPVEIESVPLELPMPVTVDQTSVVDAVGNTNSTLRDTAKGTTEAVGRIVMSNVGWLGRTFDGGVGRIVEAINAQKKDGGSSWTKVLGAVVKVVAAYYGGMAGGGIVPKTSATIFPARASGGVVPRMASGGMTPTWVGEEGPELAWLPPGTKIQNKRQLAYAGGGNTQLNYAPQYNIKIEGVQDAQEVEMRMAAFVKREDSKTKNEVMAMLRNNGFGRMR